MLGKMFSISSSINYTSDTLSLMVIGSVLPLLSTTSIFLVGGGVIVLIGLMGINSLRNNEPIKNTLER